MTFSRLSEIARGALQQSAELGFDQLVVTAYATRLLGVRIAQSAICRENVFRDEESFEAAGTWQQRSSSIETQAAGVDPLVLQITALREALAKQSPDKEYVAPKCPRGLIAWEIAGDDFDTLYGPETLYPLLEKHVARARGKGLRVTGYFEAQETRAHGFSSDGLELRTRDHGFTLTLTVDDPKSGAVGAAQRASVRATRPELDALIAETLDQAMDVCTTSGDPGELAPGDYTVVMHPSATLDFVTTALFYGMFDGRKVDEGRTYLSGKMSELRFPEGLRLAQTLALHLPNGATYADLPLNHRNVPCETLELIDGGRLRDLHLSPFWAKEKGVAETFSPHQAPPLVLEARAGSPLAGKHRTVQDLIKDTKQGIYVVNTWYLRMVAEMEGVITGMTRDGLYEIKDGKLVRPIRNMRWHDNPFRMLSAVTGLTDRKILLGRSRLAGQGRSPLAAMPGLRIEGFHFSSATRF